MVNFVLDNLCGPAGEGFDAGLELFVLPLNFDRLITYAGERSAEQRKAAFLCSIRSGLFDNLWVEHRHICAIVIKNNDPLVHTDHIRSHTNATLFVGNERVQQILCHA